MLVVRGYTDLKEVEKIQNTLNKDIKKDMKKLTKVCKKFIETQNINLMPDFEYYGSKIFDDSQQLFLIESMFEKVEDKP